MSTSATGSPTRFPVPVRRHGPAVVLRTFVDPGGVRTGVGFTSRDLLREVLGADCMCVELGVGALRALLEARGTAALTVDPRLSLSPSTTPCPSPAASPAVDRAAAVLATGAHRPATSGAELSPRAPAVAAPGRGRRGARPRG